jgi:hypothetical protein
MARFYTVETGANKRIRLYSERGLLAYLFHTVILADPLLMLSASQSSNGTALENVIDIGELRSHTVYTEFDLGAEGFGCPDGGLLLVGQQGKAFVFIEGKATPFALSFMDPRLVSSAIRDIPWDLTDIPNLVRQNSFNSSINGQMELKWRFVNAFRNLRANSSGTQVATEQTVTLPKEVMECDRFYWRRRLAPRKDHASDWRRVEVGRDLQPLLEDFEGVQKFFLLAITTDDTIPEELLRRIRLYTGDGEPLPDVQSTIFWLPMSFIERRLTEDVH